MRIGGSVLKPWHTPKEWMEQVTKLHYSAVIFPVSCDADKAVIDELKNRIEDAGLMIGEVGIWRNMLAKDPKERQQVKEYAIRQLALAEYVHASCCVNISGSLGNTWDSFHPDNYTDSTRDLIIEQTRDIIDAVKPTYTAYALEPMPWMLPDSPDSYLDLIRAVDRNTFRVHMDYTNMINSLVRYRDADQFITECFEKLGPYIRSIHVKDCLLDDYALPFSVTEKRVGEGSLNLALVLSLADKLGKDIPLFTEHLDNHDDYVYSTGYLRSLAIKTGIHMI